MSEKDLFIPLIKKFYGQFDDGSKTNELRVYGKRWNENTCYVGRGVVLSCGYGKGKRLQGIVTAFEKKHATELGEKDRQAVKDCYGTTDVFMAVIYIHILRRIENVTN